MKRLQKEATGRGHRKRTHDEDWGRGNRKRTQELDTGRGDTQRSPEKGRGHRRRSCVERPIEKPTERPFERRSCSVCIIRRSTGKGRRSTGRQTEHLSSEDRLKARNRMCGRN